MSSRIAKNKIPYLFIFSVLFIYVLFFTVSENQIYAAADNNYFNGGDGSSAAPYQIATPTQLVNLSTLVNTDATNENGKLYSSLYYELTSDLDMTAVNFSPIGTLNENNSFFVDITDYLHDEPNIYNYWLDFYDNFYTYSAINGYEVATSDYDGETLYYVNWELSPRAFYGNFNGNNHTISHLTVNGTNNVGLFGATRNAIITSVNLTYATINGENDVGGLVGSCSSSQISYCSINNSSINGKNDVGGIVGNALPEITYYFYLTIASNGEKVTVYDIDDYLARHINTKLSASLSCAVSENSTITAESGYCGGIAGTTTMSITNCINSSSVLSSGENKGGGIAGHNIATMNYLIGITDYSVNGIIYSGAIVGKNERSASNAYYPSEYVSDNCVTCSLTTNDLVGSDMLSNLTDSWTTKASENYTYYYPTPYGENISENAYSINIDGNSAALISTRNGVYILPDASDKNGYTFTNYLIGTTEIHPNDKIVIEANTDIVSVYTLNEPTATIDNTVFSRVYTGSSLLAATTNYTHDLDSLSVTYLWYFSITENGAFSATEQTSQNYYVKNVSDSGFCYCKITVSDGNISSSANTEICSVSITPSPLEITLTTSSPSPTYDGNSHIPTMSFSVNSGTISSGDNLNLDYTYTYNDTTVSDVINAGDYVINATTDNGNYSLNAHPYTFSVEYAVISYSAVGYSGDYDGNGHGISITNVLTVNEQTATIEYSNNNIVYSTSEITITDCTESIIYYRISAPNHTTVLGQKPISITQSHITLEKPAGISVITKTYDGSISYPAENITSNLFTASYTSEFSGDNPVSVLQANFSTANATNSAILTVTFTLDDSTNFVLDTSTLTYDAKIEKAIVSVSAKTDYTPITKTYDGTTSANTSDITSNHYIALSNGALPSIAVFSAEFNSKNVNEATTVTVIFGLTSVNFEFASGKNIITLDGSITPKTVTISPYTIRATDREYDGTTAVTVRGGTLVDIVPSDDVNLILGNATISSPNASTDSYLVSISSIGLSSDNYVITGEITPTYVNISKATPTVNPVVEQKNIYVSDTELPAISLSYGDTAGTISWDTYSINGAGEKQYDWSFTPDDKTNYLSATGTKTITVSAITAVSISVTTPPQKDNYVAFEAFITNGLTVELNYNDGSSIPIPKKTAFANGYTLSYVNAENYFVYGDTHVLAIYSDTSFDYLFSVKIPVTVSKIEQPIPSISGTYTYNENEQIVTLSGFDANVMNVSHNVQTNAGSYPITLTLKDNVNYKWNGTTSAEINLTWVISPLKKYLPKLNSNSFTYSGEQITVTVINPNNKTSDFFTANGVFSATNQGDYSIIVSLINNNYYWYETSSSDDYTLSWSITPQSVMIPKLYGVPLLYNGLVQNVSVDENSAYTLSGDLQAENAGNYSITASLKNIYDNDEILYKNYVWANNTTDSVTLSYAIEKVITTIPVSTTAYTYTGKAISLKLSTIANFIVGGDSVKTAAGSYRATLTLPDTANYVWADNTVEPKNIDWRIYKAVIPTPTEALGASYYSGNELTALIPESALYTISGNKATNAGTYTATLHILNSANYQWNDGTTADMTIKWTIKKRVIPVPAAPKNLTFNGLTQTAHIATNDAYTITGNSASSPGKYTATISLIDKANNIWDNDTSTDINFVFNIYYISFTETTTQQISTTYVEGTTLYTPYREGYTFDGWYASEDFSGEKITSVTELNENVSLYAKWTKVEEQSSLSDGGEKTSALGNKALIGIIVACVGVVISLILIALGFVLKRKRKL